MLLMKWNPGIQLGGAYHVASASLLATKRRSAMTVSQLKHLWVRRTERMLHSEACLEGKGCIVFCPLVSLVRLLSVSLIG